MKKTIGSTWLLPVTTGKPLSSQQRNKLRKAGAEIVSVLRESASRLTCRQFYRALPHVPGSTLRRRLTEMSSAGNLERTGPPYRYEYGLSATCVST
jgi:hypothetical protein